MQATITITVDTDGELADGTPAVKMNVCTEPQLIDPRVYAMGCAFLMASVARRSQGYEAALDALVQLAMQSRFTNEKENDANDR